MKPHVWVSQMTFSDGSTIKTGPNDVVLIVGPNNAGKSATLRFIRDRFEAPNVTSPVIAALTVSRSGTPDEVIAWVDSIARKEQASYGTQYNTLGASFAEQSLRHWWIEPAGVLHAARRLFCHMLTADERLSAANPPSNVSLTQAAPTHPIHLLQRDDSLELRLSSTFREAFGVDLIVHRNAGSTVPLYTGERPKPKEGEDRVSVGFLQELEKLPPLQSQGDGMRSFAGVLLQTAVGRESILLIDEPEAFLHPPQARLLGRVLARDNAVGRQLFVSTHSGDVLRGMLDAAVGTLRIVRLQRQGNVNVARELQAADIARLWSDPLLRYSNLLDGVFHERVIVCESDSDTRFYGAVLDAVHELRGAHAQRPDVMLTHCGGKARLSMAISSLRNLGVPVVAVADFDVLNNISPLKEIVEAFGGDWASLEKDWKTLKSAIEAKRPELSLADVKKDLNEICDEVTGPVFPDSAKNRVQEVLKRSSPWAIAKSAGKAGVPSGDPFTAVENLLAALARLGLFVVEVGEVEGFVRSVGGHGPKWVNRVLEQCDLRGDPNLEPARRFVSRFALGV